MAAGQRSRQGPLQARVKLRQPVAGPLLAPGDLRQRLLAADGGFHRLEQQVALLGVELEAALAGGAAAARLEGEGRLQSRGAAAADIRQASDTASWSAANWSTASWSAAPPHLVPPEAAQVSVRPGQERGAAAALLQLQRLGLNLQQVVTLQPAAL